MVYAGEDPKFIARRILIQASEDVGNADPMALTVANSAFEAVTKIGMPEARIILAQAAVYVATAPKSNASYMGINDALKDLETMNVGEIPYHIKDMTSSSIERKKNDQFSDKKAYKYPHAYENNYVEQQYLPDNLLGKKYYNSSNNGYEEKITKYLNEIRDHSDD
jgi:putative ATPase